MTMELDPHLPLLRTLLNSLIQTHHFCRDLNASVEILIEPAKRIPPMLKNRFDDGTAGVLAWAAAEGDAVVNDFVTANCIGTVPTDTMAIIRAAAVDVQALKDHINTNIIGLVEGDGRVKAKLGPAQRNAIRNLAGRIPPHLKVFLHPRPAP